MRLPAEGGVDSEDFVAKSTNKPTSASERLWPCEPINPEPFEKKMRCFGFNKIISKAFKTEKKRKKIHQIIRF